MDCKIFYSCVSHKGLVRRVNQDNLLCGGRYITKEDALPFALSGSVSAEEPSVFGVFDGVGGGVDGDVASAIAAEKAAAITLGDDPAASLRQFCQDANEAVCQYARDNAISSIGSTVAMVAFTGKGVTWCNIGDSKVFRFSKGKLEQLSMDHLGLAPFGRKAPLSQCLGIEPDEMIIDPYTAGGGYRDGDVYLICSDGLTDMVTQDEIRGVIDGTPFDDVTEKLLEMALANGGHDNTTIVACRISRSGGWSLSRLWRRNRGET